MKTLPFSKLSLVDAEDFTPAEQLLSRVIVSTARVGGTMFRGRLAECRVAIALRADHADLGTAVQDLRLPDPDGRSVEVKSTGTGGSFSIGVGAREVDLWVFVHVGEFEADWRFTLVSNDVVDLERERFKTPRRSPMKLSTAKVSEWGVLTERELVAAVRTSVPTV